MTVSYFSENMHLVELSFVLKKINENIWPRQHSSIHLNCMLEDIHITCCVSRTRATLWAHNLVIGFAPFSSIFRRRTGVWRAHRFPTGAHQLTLPFVRAPTMLNINFTACSLCFSRSRSNCDIFKVYITRQYVSLQRLWLLHCVT